MIMNDALPYWIDDPEFPREQHRLTMTDGPDPSLIMGDCSCGEYLYTGDSSAVQEAFDHHAEKVQRQIRE
jgi:hypothetical protein